jgi:hypothetical protein
VVVKGLQQMRVLYCAILVIILALGCSRRDPIDRLMARIPYENFPSYPFKMIELPPDASPEQLISALAKRGAFELGHFEFTTFNILEARRTHTAPRPHYDIPQENFIAVLLDTNLGRKIVVFKPMSNRDNAGWYYRTYDAK